MTHPIRIHVRQLLPALPKSPHGFHQPQHEARLRDFLLKSFPDEVPPEDTRLLKCTLTVSPGVTLRAFGYGTHVFVNGQNHNNHYTPYNSRETEWHEWVPSNKQDECEVPFIKAEITGPGTTRSIERVVRQHWGSDKTEMGLDTYSLGGYYSPTGEEAPFVYVPMRVSAEGGDTPVDVIFKYVQPAFGAASLDRDPSSGNLHIASEFHGVLRTWKESLKFESRTVRLNQNQGYGYGRDGTSTCWSTPLDTLYRNIKNSTLADGVDALWARFFAVNAKDVDDNAKDLSGVSNALKHKTVKPLIETLQKDAPLEWRFFQWLQSSATDNKQKNNTLLSTFLLSCEGDYDKLIKGLQKARTETAYTTPSEYSRYGDVPKGGYGFASRRAICLSLPGAAEKVLEVEARADYSKRRGLGAQADGLGVAAEDFPLLRAAIESGEIPISIFRQPDKTPVNVEFPLWEKALVREGWAPILYEIAKDAGRRSTYEKDITPYIAFLYRIEKYLKRHAPGLNWKAMPKYVESQWDLEMDDDAKEGTSKKRSAFTPVADNETGIVTVPYVAVVVSGVRTQWCYAQNYHLFEEGFQDPVSGGIVVNDFETRLNGRDDYGLCFYTLIGTSTATGYPTFLIIFERINLGRSEKNKPVIKTRVHFHRVRPQRIKDGIKTPACKLVDACYQYMAGNVNASEITAQQGDLIFIKHPNDPIAAGAKVEPVQEAATITFESHQFAPLTAAARVSFHESAAKTPANRLGFINVPVGGMAVKHPEHENIHNLGEGWYEIRRTKSWEASPKGIWVLTID